MKRRLKYISVYRIFTIVAMATKFLLQIFWFQKKHRIWDKETKRMWEEMLAAQAGEYRRKAIELGGLLIKFGQFLSSREDLLPSSFIRELEGLVDRVEPVPFEQSKKNMEEEWGAPIDEHLSRINETPIASASIGEVYNASLKDGTLVAVKVQRYRVKDIFQIDFKALRIIFWLLARFTSYGKKADLPALYREVVKVISNELDFTMELKNGNYFREKFREFSSVYVPEYYGDLSTKRVLVMEWIEGAKITDVAFITKNSINREQVAKTLFDLCVEQFLYSGRFHSDPHPGNLMLKPDGTIVMIDFGMVGEVHKRDAKSIRTMIQGFILDDYDRVIESLIDMEFLLHNADTERVKKILKQTVDMYIEGNFDKLDAHMMNELLNDMQKFIKEQPIQLPADYAFLGRAASIIVGVLTTVYPQVDLVKWGRPEIQKWMGEGSTFSLYKEVVKESARPLMSLPRALIEYLEDGDKEREWQNHKQRNHLFHQFYLFHAFIWFTIFLTGSVLLLFTIIQTISLPVWIGASLTGTGALGLCIVSFRHLRMLKNLH